MHESINLERVFSLSLRDDNLGICIECGEEAHGVEPDARDYKCQSCGEYAVYGAEELIFMGVS